MTDPLANQPPPGPPPSPVIRPGGSPPPDMSGGGIGGFWRGRTAGLPNWGWVLGGVVVGGAALWFYFHRKTNATNATPANAGQATVVDDSSGIATGQYESILAQLRDIQGQPSVPGPAGPTGPAGPAGQTGDAGPVGPASTPVPAQTATAVNLAPQGKKVSIGTGANVYDFARSVYGSALGINTLRAVNPLFDSYLRWGSPDSQGNLQPFIIKGRSINT